jgi:diguanylate cyclase (GGDEF)-like protein
VTRLRGGCVQVLREVASAQHPVVLVLDDLQWAGPFPVALVDAILDDADLAGVLLVGSYRDGGGRARWQPSLNLVNLPTTDVATLLAEMLRLDPPAAAALAEPVGARSGGNPYDTVELVNALRRDGVLRLGPAGWAWDAAEVRGHLGAGDVLALVTGPDRRSARGHPGAARGDGLPGRRGRPGAARRHRPARPRTRGRAGRAGGRRGRVAVQARPMAVLEASRALSSATSLERLRERVVEVAGTLTGATGVRLVLHDPAGWVVSDEDGEVPVESPRAARLLPVSAFRFAERTGEPLLVADAVRDGRFTTDPYFAGTELCALLIMPVLVQGVPRAMLVLENNLSRGAFRADRLDVLRLIAGQLAVSLDNALLYAAMERKVAERTEELASANDRLDRLSRTDSLTGCANRREFDERLAHEWSRGVRSGGDLTVMLLDVDHFKLYNDRYGHPAGDVCLREVARAVQGAVRDTDLVARYGGEGFALILPGPMTEGGPIVAERIRASVEGLGIPHAEAARGIVTISLGVAAAAPASGGEPGKLVSQADTALYGAKRQGRNRVGY